MAVTSEATDRAMLGRMADGFHVLRKLDDGQLLRVGWRATFREAEQLIADLREHWPAEYIIEEGGSEAPQG